MTKTYSYEAEKLYKEIYLTFCADSCMSNRLTLAGAEDALIYHAGYTSTDIEELQDEALEELEEQEVA